MNFFKSFFASFLAVIVAFLIGIPFLFIIIGGIFSAIGSSNEVVAVNPKTVLHLKLNTPIVENAAIEPVDFNFDKFMPLPIGGSTSKMGLFQIRQALKQASEDKNIEGIYLNTNVTVPASGWTTMKAIRDALIDFKASGKFIYAYSEVYSENSYYLASVADKIYMPAVGSIEFNGFGATPMFYTGLFEKIDLEPKIFKVGTFKSAVEPYMLKKMSDANRLQTEKYMGDLWKIFSQEVSVSRSLTPEEIDDIAQNLILGRGTDAKKVRLIDEVAYENTVFDEIRTKIGLEVDDKITFMSLNKYMRVPSRAKASKNKIAVIFAEGGIQSGKSSDGVMGSETIVDELRKARKDKSVKAIVFRVNSRGGSALASDMIAEEVRLCSEEKPIIASMGDYAASGGYYISAKCDKIYAQTNTITGSIGIFGILYNTRNTFTNNLGITFDEVETHEHANIGHPNYPMTKAEEAFIQNMIHEGYSTFINVVKDGRGFADSASVDQIAQGRVWSGLEAKNINLIDEFGDLDDAIEAAAKMANIEDDYRIIRTPKVKSLYEELLNDMLETTSDKISQQHPLYEEMKTLETIKKEIPKSGVYMLMPYTLEIN